MEDNKIKYGVLHCHTDNSIRDSVLSVSKLVARGKELGAPAIALTDHGSMTGYIEFMRRCNDSGIKPIVGVEAYVQESKDEQRKHLILMAKDYEGFQALIKAVSASNQPDRVKKVKTLMFPTMNKAILKRCFGPGAQGHGHVIATSACVSGPLAAIILANSSIDGELETLRASQAEYESPQSKSYAENTKRLGELKEQQSVLSAEMKELKKQADKKLLSLERKYLNAKDEQKRAEAKRIFDEESAKRAAAIEELSAKKEEKATVDAEYKRLNDVVKITAKSVARWQVLQGKIDDVLKRHISDDELDEALQKEAEWYRENFGDDFYIELQYHGMKEEKRVMTRLAELSDEMGIPVCIANDVHIAQKTGDDILGRAVIRAMAFDKWEEPTAYDKELYMKTDEELIEKLKEIIPEQKVLEGYENVGKIAGMCNLVIPEGGHYPKFQTPDGSTAEEYLRRMTYERVHNRFTDEEFTEEHRARMEHELDIICSMGYADYHLIVEDMLRYARAAGKLYLSDEKEREIALSFDTELIEKYTDNRVGECVGPGRGSAGGSLVCYIIGITNIDPMKYGLLFERFLNPDRISMPDIDCGATCSVTSLKR